MKSIINKIGSPVNDDRLDQIWKELTESPNKQTKYYITPLNNVHEIQ